MAPPAIAGAGSTSGWVATGLVGAGAVLFAARSVGIEPGACLLRSHTGLACPACGFTRLTDAIAQGDIAGALTRDPPGTVLLVLVAVTCLAQLVALRGRRVPGLGHGALPLAAAALLAAHWSLGLASSGFTA